ncbi:MAG: hypothetical protein K2X27_21315 [Candidatus Obscuribacterales bacterium]|nr:hypothetical protein [Candidatus Obscuribacterales bacterium]
MFEKFGQMPLKIIFTAREEARSLGDLNLDSEHILLALLSLDCAAARALKICGLTYLEVKTELEELRSEQDALSEEQEIAFSESCRRILEFAFLESRMLKEESILAEHILLAVLKEGQGVAIGLLAHFGINIIDLEIALLYQLAAEKKALADENQLPALLAIWSRLRALAEDLSYRDLAQEALKQKRLIEEALQAKEIHS